MNVKLNDREVTDIEISGIDTNDHPDYVDVFIDSARWSDTDAELSEDELEELNENLETKYNLVMEYLF